MAKEPIKASVWKECAICDGYGDDPHNYEEPQSMGPRLCIACGGSGGHYEKFIVTPTGVIPKLDT
jgi:hypothetical protein